MVFFRNFEGIFEIQNQSAVGNALPGSYVYNHPTEFQLHLPGNGEDWSQYHIYHNNRHWWGSDRDYRELEFAYEQIRQFVSDNWPEGVAPIDPSRLA
jgi:hypothetical protein